MNNKKIKAELQSISDDVAETDRLWNAGLLSPLRYDIRKLYLHNRLRAIQIDILRENQRKIREQKMRKKCIRNIMTNEVRRVKAAKAPAGWVFTTKSKFKSFVRNHNI